MRSRRVETTSPDFRVAVLTRDEETGNALRIEYDDDGELLRHAIVTRFPRQRWDGDVIGETVWYDAGDREMEDDSKKGVAEVIISKHRNGPTGSFNVAWMSRYAKFATLAQ